MTVLPFREAGSCYPVAVFSSAQVAGTNRVSVITRDRSNANTFRMVLSSFIFWNARGIP